MTVPIALKQVSVGNRLIEVNIRFDAGQHYHILGPNGAGKSTLLSVLSGVLPVTDGVCLVDGEDIRRYRLPDLARWRCYHHAGPASAFDLTVDELWRFFVPSFKDVPLLVERAFEVGALQQRALLSLSSGERQRVHLARSLMQIWPAIERGQGLILLDEPLSTLDIRHQLLCLHLLQQLAAQGNTVVMTSHDVQLSRQYAQQLVFLKDARLLTMGSGSEVVTDQVLSHVYDCPVTVQAGSPSLVQFSLFSS